MKNKQKKNKKTEIYFQNSFEIKKNPKGDVYKILSNKSKIYKGFGELYITTLNKDSSKGWNYHKRMTLNLFVIKGKVRFFLKKNNELVKKTLSENKNDILTIKPKVWVKIVNLAGEKSKIINFANLKHNQNEIIKKEIR
tara:strand:- start:1204 stop:1620 length:417 start_codon:yes stop_codon:yes gene_type:complete